MVWVLKERIRFYFNDLETPAGKITDIMIIALIILACIVYAAQNYPITAGQNAFLALTELIIGLAFTVEYILRLWVAKKRIKHIFNIYSIIDLIAIIPVFLVFANLQFLRVFRIFRIFRLLRFLEHRFFFFGEITQTMLIVSRIIFIIATIVFTSASLILIAEKDVNPQLNTFTDGIYFSIVTITTVGFGDIVPLTQSGRLITILIIMSGIIFIPLQLGKLIPLMISTSTKTKIECEKCGLTHHETDAVHCKHCGALIYQKTRGSN